MVASNSVLNTFIMARNMLALNAQNCGAAAFAERIKQWNQP
jgi:hypothetical protein